MACTETQGEPREARRSPRSDAISMGRWSLPGGDDWCASDADRLTVIRFRPAAFVGTFSRRSLGRDGSDTFGAWPPKDTGPEHLAMLKPGCESAITQPARSSHERRTPTALLDHREHAGDEREGAAARGGVDLRDGLDSGDA